MNDQQEDAISVSFLESTCTRICGTLVKITSCDFLPHDSSCERNVNFFVGLPTPRGNAVSAGVVSLCDHTMKLRSLPEQTYLTSPVVAVVVFAGVAAIGVVLYGLYLLFCDGRVRRRATKREPLIVLSWPQFDVPAAAAAAAVFERAGMGFRLTTFEGGRTDPDGESLQSKVAQAAAKRMDPTWMKVINAAITTASLPSCFTKPEYLPKVIFIPGGAHALKQLREVDLKGPSPSRFCRELHALCLAVLDSGGAIGATGHGAHGLPPIKEDSSAHSRRIVGELDSSAECTARKLLDVLGIPAEAPSQAAGSSGQLKKGASTSAKTKGA